MRKQSSDINLEKISVLISTIDNRLADISSENLPVIEGVDYCIVHQRTASFEKSSEELARELLGRRDVALKLSSSVGLSKSRNTALEICEGDICLLCDDDVVLKRDFAATLRDAFRHFDEASVCTFQIQTDSDRAFRKYSNSSERHTRYSIGSVCSIEIAFRKTHIKKTGITFDEQFGLGAGFPIGEEFIFLNDCLDAGLLCYFYQNNIAYHPPESTGSKLSNELARAKGAVYRRVYGIGFWPAAFYFVLKHRRRVQRQIGLNQFLKELFRGSQEYSHGRK